MTLLDVIIGTAIIVGVVIMAVLIDVELYYSNVYVRLQNWLDSKRKQQ
jgi:hypothetical protein